MCGVDALSGIRRRQVLNQWLCGSNPPYFRLNLHLSTQHCECVGRIAYGTAFQAELSDQVVHSIEADSNALSSGIVLAKLCHSKARLAALHRAVRIKHSNQGA